ncbi:MAG TPA: serine/threonine-protein kinase [Anaerolineales bacterium]|nr:serine/threonine-protein kinase [Anaerolineales bacterium]
MTAPLGPARTGTASLSQGTVLESRYSVLRKLGRGGMSAVYQARDLRFPNITRLVAVKELLHSSHDAAMLEAVLSSFEREANLLATLTHPAIPRIYDYFTIGERSFLVMEYITGRDLEGVLEEAPDGLPVVKVVGWSIELCDVLHYLHNHTPPIIFRDMKPSNVMIDENGILRLVDFGIAKLFAPDHKGTMIGTEGYSPPEQYRGEAGPLSDVYALGATLHHLLTRRDPRLEPPFTWGDRPIPQLRPEVPAAVVAVVEKALAYDAKSRFADAHSMGEALAQSINTTIAVFAAPQPVVEAPGRSSVADQPGAPKVEWVFKCEDEVRGTPLLARDLLLVGAYDNNLYALNAERGEFLWKYPTEGGIPGRPEVGDDTVFVGSEDQRLHAVSLQTGRMMWTYYTERPIRASPRVAVEHVFIGSDDGALHAVQALTGRRVWKCDTGAPVRSTALVVGDRIYFGSDSGDVYALSLRGEIKWQFHAKRAVLSSPAEADGMVLFGSVDWVLYAVDSTSGWVIWRFRTGHSIVSSPAIAEGVVVFGSADGRIYAADLRSSRERWRFETEDQVTGTPLIHKGLVYCGSVDGYLYCLELASGRLRWKFKSGGPITGAPAANETSVFFGSSDHTIYALSANV